MNTAKVIVKIKSAAPFQYGRFHQTEKLPRETHDAYEKRTWRERVHADENGVLFIPATNFKLCLAEAAKFFSKQIPGKGKSTYTKHFEAGVLCEQGITTQVTKGEVRGLWLNVPSDGKRGGTSRVPKCFPVLQPGEWDGELVFRVLDPTITEEVFTEHIIDAGKFIGVGSFRPRNNGDFGRFAIESVEWLES